MMARRLGNRRRQKRLSKDVDAHQPDIGWAARRDKRSVDELPEATSLDACLGQLDARKPTSRLRPNQDLQWRDADLRPSYEADVGPETMTFSILRSPFVLR